MAKKDEKRNVKPPTRLAVDISKNGKPQMRYWVFQEALTFDENGVPLTWIPYYKTCNKCGGVFYDRNREEAMSQSGDINENFYQDYDTIDNNFDGHLQTCKNCLFSSCDNNDGIIDQKKLIKALMKYNKVYNHTKFLNVFEKKQSSKNYFSSLSSLAGQREKGFLESDKEAFEILIEMAKEENSKLDFSISQEDIDFIQDSDGDFDEDNEDDDKKSTNYQKNKNLKLAEKWGSKFEESYTILENKYNNYVKNHNVNGDKYESDLVNLCVNEVLILNTEDIKERDSLNNMIIKAKDSLQIRQKDKRDDDINGYSISEFMYVTEKNRKLLPWEYVRKMIGVSQDLVDKTILYIINGYRYYHKLDELKHIDEFYSNFKDPLSKISIEDYSQEITKDDDKYITDIEKHIEEQEELYKR